MELGGHYECAREPLQSFVVIDSGLYTGQNPASAKPLAEIIIGDLKKRK